MMSNEKYIERIREVIDNHTPVTDLLDTARALDAIPLPDKPSLYSEVLADGYEGALEFEYQCFAEYSGAKLDEMIRANGELDNNLRFNAMRKALNDYDAGTVYEERFVIYASYEYYTPTSGWRLGDTRLSVTRFCNATSLEEAIQEAEAWAPIVPIEIEDVTRYYVHRGKRLHSINVHRSIVREVSDAAMGCVYETVLNGSRDRHEVMRRDQVAALANDRPVPVSLDWHSPLKKSAAFIPFLYRINGEKVQGVTYGDIKNGNLAYEGVINAGETPQNVVGKMLADIYGYDGPFAIFQAEHRDDILGPDVKLLRRYSINIILQSDSWPKEKVMGGEVVWRDCMRASLYSVY